MTRPLTGAAKTAQARRILLDEARQAITRRDPNAVHDTLALLRAVDAKTPRRPVAPRQLEHADDPVVTRYTGHGLSHGTYHRDVRVHPVLQSDHLEIAALKGLRSLRVDDAYDRASR